jgi:putative ABC transport system substrate-binding protein
MKRRDFLGIVGGGAMVAGGPLSALAQPIRPQVVGLLRSSASTSAPHVVAAFRRGLAEAGFTEGRNVTIEERWADNQLERLPKLADDLVRQRVSVIVCNGPAVGPVKAATQTIPIVFVVGDDPIKMGLVKSLSRPESNLTGVTFFGGGRLGAKRLELLRETMPNADTVAVITDPGDTGFAVERTNLEATARMIGLRLVFIEVAGEHELDTAFAKIVQAQARAILLGGGPLLFTIRERIVALVAQSALPTIYELREYVLAGGLMSYSASFAAAYHQAGEYAARILKGAKPAELPVVQPKTFELVVNLKTAKALGLTVPPTLLARADEVIE